MKDAYKEEPFEEVIKHKPGMSNLDYLYKY